MTTLTFCPGTMPMGRKEKGRSHRSGQVQGGNAQEGPRRCKEEFAMPRCNNMAFCICTIKSVFVTLPYKLFEKLRSFQGKFHCSKCGHLSHHICAAQDVTGVM
jgi:hypothetical protein